MACNHISLYQLTVERGTPLARDVREGKLVSKMSPLIIMVLSSTYLCVLIQLMPDDDSMADMYEHAVNVRWISSE